MNDCLFRISLAFSDPEGRFYGQDVDPVYYVAGNDEEVIKWCKSNVKDEYTVTSITKLAAQISRRIFSGKF